MKEVKATGLAKCGICKKKILKEKKCIVVNETFRGSPTKKYYHRSCYFNKYPNYEEAYNILMDYFDYIPEGEDREEVDKRLKECGL